MFHRSLSFSFALLLLLAVGCSDSAKNGSGGTPTCDAGKVYNPVTGACMIAGSANAQPGPDAGGNNTLGGDTGTSVGPTDMGSNNTTPPTDAGTTDAGTDMSTSCTGNERRCNQGSVETCVNGMFMVTDTCQADEVCMLGNCVPASSGMCTPGETRCQGPSTVQTCQSDGMTWSTTQTCAMGESCAAGQCTSGCAGLINGKSNVGCEYVTMRENQASGLRVLPHSVVVSNPGDMPVDVAVTSPSGINTGIAQQTIAPNDSAVLNFPTTPMISSPGLSPNIYLIQSTRPVIATQFSPLNNPGVGNETSDASLLLPTNAVGKDYVVVGWPSLQPAGTYVDIVSLQDNTTVTVTAPLPLSGGSAGSVPENGTATFTIPKNQVLHLAENRSIFDTGSRDVSGVRISSNNDVAVFTGATIVNIPDSSIVANPPASCTATGSTCVANSDCCSGICGYDPMGNGYACVEDLQAGDHVEQQLFPVESWGATYVAAPYFNRGTNDFDIYRVVGATDGTTVTLDPPVNGESSFTLNAGEVHEIYSPDAFELNATNPVMLAQFMIGGSIAQAGDGDPAFMIPAATQQYRDSYVFLVPANYATNFVTIVKKSGTQVSLDGTMVPQAQFQSVGGSSTWEYAIMNSVAAGVHQATSSDKFGVVVHGMDYYISYAFAGGITLPN